MNRQYTALVLEESRTTRRLISGALESVDIDVYSEGSIEEIYRVIESNYFDIYIFDADLKYDLLFELTSYLLDINLDSVVIVVSEEYNAKEVKRFFKKGISDFIIKPIDYDIFTNKVISLIKNVKNKSDLVKANSNYARLMDEKSQEEILAFYVYDHILSTQLTNIDSVDGAHYSHGRFCGDILVSALSPTGSLYIILADATGHGMAAALTIYPLVSTFNAVVSKGLNMAAIINEISEKHIQLIPGNRFVAAILIEVRPTQNDIRIWNAGMPDVLIMEGKEVRRRVKSSNMAIGVLPTDILDKNIEVVPMLGVTHLMAMSDGVIENKENDGHVMDFSEAYSYIATLPYESETIISHMKMLDRGKNEELDDMTVCVIDVCELKNELEFSIDKRPPLYGDFKTQFSLLGDSIRNESLPMRITDFIEFQGLVKPFCQRVFTVVSELYSNSVEHGVLGFDAKNKISDYASFIEQKEEKLASLNRDDRVEISFEWSEMNQALTVEVFDTGEGYKMLDLSSSSDDSLNGRGLKLCQKLSDQFSYDEKNNTTKVMFKYREGL
ncbi:fused response regulator/phosphatase [Marinomonas balearica]|uniref:Response regulator receiver protein n=1 Tax=Marinomonas balearica TaxID=491947 RepID=A0A4V3CG42_9GAMM|nr:fused response regulator/phosphatase [Marinomonas balearica]TDO96342.1 response regulator receiver protein [Marinomonas balearica]